MMDGEGVYVLWWKYSDGSGAGVVRAYRHKEDAEEDREILAGGVGDGMKEFFVVPVPLR